MLQCVHLLSQCNGNLSSGTLRIVISETPTDSWCNGFETRCGCLKKQFAIISMTNWFSLLAKCKVTYVLFFRRNTQNRPDKKNINDIIKYNSGNGISPADKKLLLFASSMSIWNLEFEFFFFTVNFRTRGTLSEYLHWSWVWIDSVDNLDMHGSINCTDLPLVGLRHKWWTMAKKMAQFVNFSKFEI